jgi:ornithine cyclodeaminase
VQHAHHRVISDREADGIEHDDAVSASSPLLCSLYNLPHLVARSFAAQILYLALNFCLFINAIGGDCPGKTELDPQILKNSRIVVEYYEQTKIEGEIQNLRGKTACDEMWEIVQGTKKGRRRGDGIIVFDSVGFAVADYSMMRMLHERNYEASMSLLPAPRNAKNLIAEFKRR